MAELQISVGGRGYAVACKDGEEPHLAEVAGLLASEADALRRQFTALPEGRLLLMAGLMTADKLHGARAELARARTGGGAAASDGLFAAPKADAPADDDLRAALEAMTARAEAAEARLAQAEAGEAEALAAFEAATQKLRSMIAGINGGAAA